MRIGETGDRVATPAPVRIALADPATTAVVACARADNAGSLRVLAKLGLGRVGEVMLPGATEPTVTLARHKGRNKGDAGLEIATPG